MLRTFDYIVIGGGSAGCVMASRLSEKPGTTVCLIEPGGSGTGTIIDTPAAMVAMLPTRLHNWALHTTPQAGLEGRCGYQPRGKALGGSSAINAMVYTRGNHRDYDRWAQAGNYGWGFKDVLPYFRRAENNEWGACGYHGDLGPLAVSDQRSHNPFNDIFLHAAMQSGHNMNRDFNGAQQDGFGIYQVTQKDGKRCSAAHAYLSDSVRRRSNLTIELHTSVQRILMAGQAAYGVQFLKNNHLHNIVAHKEVILCAGAIHSPQLLMISGIGDKAHLRANGVECIHDLPGVGQNLQDRLDFVFGYKLQDTRLMGASLAAIPTWVRALQQYRHHGGGMLASNYAESGGFIKTSCDLSQPDIQTIFVPALVEDHARKFNWGHGYSCHTILLQPKSRGSVCLQGNSIQTAPLIDPQFLSHADDLQVLMAGFKTVRDILQAPAFAQLGAKDHFTEGVETDDQIEKIIRQRADSEYHPVGTCRMGRDRLSVVNARLQVHGVRGLRVVDASIMPSIVSGNTNGPTIMIAEKAAHMVQQDNC